MDQFKIVILAEAAIILIQLMVIVSMRRRILELSKLHAHFSQFAGDAQITQKDAYFVKIAGGACCKEDKGSAGAYAGGDTCSAATPYPVGAIGPQHCLEGSTGADGQKGSIGPVEDFSGPTLPNGKDSPEAGNFDFLSVGDSFKPGDQYGVGFCFTIGDPATTIRPGDVVTASMIRFLPRRLKKVVFASAPNKDQAGSSSNNDEPEKSA